MIMEWVKWLFRSGAIWAAVFGACVIGAYEVLMPEEPPLTYNQECLLKEFRQALHVRLSRIQPVRGRCNIAGFSRDHFGRLTDVARRAVIESDLFDVQQRSVWEKFRRRIKWTVPVQDTRTAAAAYAERRKADCVVWGRVESFRDLSGKSVLKGMLVIYDLRTQDDILEFPFELGVSGPSGVSIAESSLPLASRLKEYGCRVGGWLLVMALLPVVLYAPLRKIVASDSNVLILITLVALTIVSFLLAWLLLPRETFLPGVHLLLAVIISFGYNWRVMDFIKCNGESGS